MRTTYLKEKPEEKPVPTKPVCPDANHVSIHIDLTIDEELQTYRNALENLDSNTEAYSRLEELLGRTEEVAELMQETGETMYIMSQRRPPDPCPGHGGSSCLYMMSCASYFDIAFNRELVISKNDIVLNAKTVNYDCNTKIRTVQLAEQLLFDEHDVITIELPVTYHDKNGSVTTRTFTKKITGIKR